MTPQIYTQTDCRTCTLANAMRDCPACRFFGGQSIEERTQKYYPLATSADVDAMWKRLWGDVQPDYVRMQLDAAHEHGKELTDLCEGLHIGEARA